MSLSTFALLTNMGISLGIGLVTLRKSKRPGITGVIALSFFTAIWSLCYLLYAIFTLQSQNLFLTAAIYFCSTNAASALLVFTLSFTSRQRQSKGLPLVLLGAMPVLTQVFFWIGPWHTIFFAGQNTQTADLVLTTGLWAKVNTIYIYSLVGISVWLLFDAVLRKPASLFTRAGAILAGVALPLLAQILNYLNINLFSGMELSLFAFTLAGLGFAYGLLNQQLPEVTPIDREAVVEGTGDGWMVLNTQNIIVDINPAAERMIGLSREKVYGQPITSVLSDLPNLGKTFDGSQELEMKRSIKSQDGWKYLNIRISSLVDRDQQPFGRLAVWRDITERKLTEDARQRARDEMFVLINAISSAAGDALNLEDFLLESIYHIIYPFRSQVVGIFLLGEVTQQNDKPKLYLASHLGLSADAIRDMTYMSSSSPLFDWAIKNRQPLQIEGAGDDLRVPSVMRQMALACILTIPLIIQAGEESKIIGCICLARKEKPIFSQDEIIRLTTISDHIATLIDSDRRRKLAITRSERERLMRDLHDSVSQKLYGLVTMTEAAQAAMEAGTAVDPSQVLSRIGENARQAVKEMRLFLYQMQPIDVEKDGLISVLHHRLAAVEGRADTKTRLLADDEIALSKDKEVALYYIAQEALNNALRHARAKSILVTLKQGRQNVILEISDDGCGFDPKKVELGGLGLQNMHERTSQINGKFKIVSKPGQGTKITITVHKDPSVKLSKHRR